MAKTLSRDAELIKGVFYDQHRIFSGMATSTQLNQLEVIAERFVELLEEINSRNISTSMNQVQAAVDSGFSNVDTDITRSVSRIEDLEKENQGLREQQQQYHNILLSLSKEVKRVQDDLESAHAVLKDILDRAPILGR